MYQLIASPFLGNHFVLKPGMQNGVRISEAKYTELRQSAADAHCPPWLVDVARDAWNLERARNGGL